MAKVIRNKKVNNIKKIAATKVDGKLSLLLIVLALLVLALAAISLTGVGNQNAAIPKVKVAATHTAKPVVKATVKPTTTVKK